MATSVAHELCISVAHVLPGRVRMHIDPPVADPLRLEKAVMHRSGVHAAVYTPISQTMLIHFDASQVSMEEVLLRASMSLSLANNLKPVMVKQPSEQVPLSQLSLAAGLLLALGHASALVGKTSGTLSFVAPAAGATTAMAIGEHVFADIRAKKAPDPEVVSFGYLLISLLRGRLLQGASVAWVMTFARHILEPPASSLLVETSHTANGCDIDGCELEATVSHRQRTQGMAKLLGRLPQLLAGLQLSAADHAFQEIQSLASERNNILEGLEHVNRGIRLTVIP